jgi:ATP-binding cassette subfamily F protein 3
MLLASDKPVKAEKPKPARPARPDRDTMLALRAEVRKCEARVEKIEQMRETLAKKLADPALYEPGRKGELETWNKKYAEVMDGLRRAEALWETAAEKLDAAENA